MISVHVTNSKQDLGIHIFSNAEAIKQFCGDQYQAKVVPGSRKHWTINADAALVANKEYQINAAKKFLARK